MNVSMNVTKSLILILFAVCKSPNLVECLSLFFTTCQRQKLVVIKSIRARMAAAELAINSSHSDTKVFNPDSALTQPWSSFVTLHTVPNKRYILYRVWEIIICYFAVKGNLLNY